MRCQGPTRGKEIGTEPPSSPRCPAAAQWSRAGGPREGRGHSEVKGRRDAGPERRGSGQGSAWGGRLPGPRPPTWRAAWARTAWRRRTMARRGRGGVADPRNGKGSVADGAYRGNRQKQKETNGICSNIVPNDISMTDQTMHGSLSLVSPPGSIHKKGQGRVCLSLITAPQKCIQPIQFSFSLNSDSLSAFGAPKRAKVQLKELKMG